MKDSYSGLSLNLKQDGKPSTFFLRQRSFTIRNSLQDVDLPAAWQVDHSTERLVRKLKTESDEKKKKKIWAESRVRVVAKTAHHVYWMERGQSGGVRH